MHPLPRPSRYPNTLPLYSTPAHVPTSTTCPPHTISLTSSCSLSRSSHPHTHAHTRCACTTFVPPSLSSSIVLLLRITHTPFMSHCAHPNPPTYVLPAFTRPCRTITTLACPSPPSLAKMPDLSPCAFNRPWPTPRDRPSAGVLVPGPMLGTRRQQSRTQLCTPSTHIILPSATRPPAQPRIILAQSKLFQTNRVYCSRRTGGVHARPCARTAPPRVRARTYSRPARGFSDSVLNAGKPAHRASHGIWISTT
ncbi:hypothetical protein FKP32DRAFT_1267877 [Trametes sanguinea]|nr:hypothetical protein FKP32DRAFT_1267877 [Trametes sanguinea]